MAKARDLLCCSLNCGALSTRRATGRALFLASNAQRDMDSPKGTIFPLNENMIRTISVRTPQEPATAFF